MATHFGLRNCVLALAVVAALNPAAARAEPVKAVLELFTSQGCSSCPPADRIFEELTERSDVITVSLPVDYWDSLGWKDTLAKPAFTQRQRGYSQSRRDGEVYTPQAVVNGRSHLVASNRGAVHNAIDASRTLPVQVDITRSDSGVTVAVGAGPSGLATSASVILLPIVASREVVIGRGENANRSVTYTNVARGIDTVGIWSGAAQTFEIPAQRLGSSDGVVVLLQTGGPQAPGLILGAARLQLR